uniref:Ig-like domain-containing protein n=1 Tax=Cyprinus carpio TaxID=7962 RepID=A0A8C1QV30_CYPCA
GTLNLECTVYGNEIRPTKTEEFASLTLSCSYSSVRSLFWYRQYPGSAPEFLVTLTYRATEAKKLSVILTKREQKHVDLIISSAAVSDSALYYCALRPTVTGNTSALYKNPLPSESEKEYRSYNFKLML